LSFALAPADAGWHEITGRLDLGSDSIPSWYDSRGDVFVLSNQSGNDSAIDIAQVRLIDPQGREWLANGDFAAGGDRWFAYNDFQHLAWHLKSLYVAIYFDLGWLGVTAFGVLAATALWRAFGQARRGHLFGAALAAAIVGFLALGLTGTLLDVPPLMTLSLLLGSAALWRERVRRRIVKPMRTPSGSPGFPPARSAVPGS
jgi:hypothetical protein